MRNVYLRAIKTVSTATLLLTTTLLAGGFAAPSQVTPSATSLSAVLAIDPPTMKTNPNGDPYLIGAISWDGFTEGTHWGWRRLQHYPDREPLLGFYDSTSTEVWDWNIKFAKEHGINFFSFVWSRGSEAGEPVGQPRWVDPIETFKQSQFSNQMKYTLNWT